MGNRPFIFFIDKSNRFGRFKSKFPIFIALVDRDHHFTIETGKSICFVKAKRACGFCQLGGFV